MKNLFSILCFLFTFALTAQTATEYFTLAKEQASKKKYYKAIPNYKKAIAKDSTNLEYYWFLSEAILKENIRGSHRTDSGVFEGLEILDKMIKKGATSVKIYEQITTTNQYILNDYSLRYKNFTPKPAATWQDEKPDTSAKEQFKAIALTAYNAIVESSNKILALEPNNAKAISTLKYLKKPEF